MSHETRDVYEEIPGKKGRLAIFPAVYEGNHVIVSIMGDSDGLRYLARMLEYMADVQVEKQNMPTGERAHISLHPGRQLISHSCDVEICRAEAKGSGTLPLYFKE